MRSSASKTQFRGKTVLVTGGAGFIGSHLVTRLVDMGSKVVVLDNMADGTITNIRQALPYIELIKEDITAPKNIKRYIAGLDYVFHLAANASVPRSISKPVYDFNINAMGTLRLLDLLRGSNLTGCVVASSGAVYGQPTKFPIRENDTLNPISPYGASKMAAEAVCRTYFSAYKMPVSIARIFNTYGPRQPRYVMYDFYKKLRKNPRSLEILGSGRQVRDYCYIDDTVDALLRIACLKNKTCEAYNISSGKYHNVVEIAEAMCRIMKLGDTDIHFSGKSWEGDAQHWEVSIAKLKKHTGYKPRFNINEGLDLFIKWFDSQK